MPSLKEYFMLDRLGKFRDTLKQVGGFKAAFKQMYLTDDLKKGNFVGEDQFGNRYFEDNSQFMPRNRWVIYTEKKWLEYDGSQIPPEWHRWIHHICDKPPTIEKLSSPKWQLEHQENLSVELSKKYVPYSTTRPKVQGWTGPGRKDIGV
uniref:NADH dehydrogenase [ubiquinone] 1 alpha subcomplex subunit 12 n=2 Tax=Meloidogyne TaxID=189290 RepID=A0A914MZ74_MELIC|nr:unnamed protein product [Meloidogyne enterolobii]